MIETRAIPQSEWRDFFSGFSHQHDDQTVAIEVMGAEIGAQVEGRQLRLRGISPTQHRESSDLAVMVDSMDGSHFTHTIEKPVQVWLQQTPDRIDQALEIESADGTKTLVRLETQFAGTSAPAERFPRKGDDGDFME